MGEKTITISCPVQNRSWILSHYLNHIHQIDYPKKLINLYFILNNSTDDSEQILKDFKSSHQHEYNEVKIDYYNSNKNFPKDERVDDIRLKYTYKILSELRNRILKYASNNSDYLLSCDSDILVRPDILNKLLSTNKEIVSSLIYNGYLFDKEKPYLYPNILKYDQYGRLIHIANYYVKNSPTLTESKVIPIDATGAVILLSRNVCKRTRYSWDKQGEDISWSRDCKDKGFGLWCELSSYSSHIMSEELLKEYVDTNNKK